MPPATNVRTVKPRLGESYIRQAEAPVPVMKKSMAAPSTVAYVMQEKFQNGVPLYRQEAYWKGQGVELRRNTMANWVIRSAVGSSLCMSSFAGSCCGRTL